MSQNIPPENGDPRADHSNPDSNPNPNPYYNSLGGAPDLDAGAPELRDEESQRVNRKALLFLAAIVVLVILMGVMLLAKLRSDDAPRAKAPREEKPYVPDVPGGLPSAPLPPPEQTASTPAAAPIPTLPTPPLPQQGPSQRDGAPRGPSLMERRMGSVGGMGGSGAAEQSPEMAAAYARRNQMKQQQQQLLLGQGNSDDNSAPGELQMAPTTLASYLRKPDTLLLRGTYLRCVLETHIVTDVPGFTSCVVTEPVYSVNGKRLLLPKGSKLSGTYGGGTNGPRVAVVWDRITTPTGLDITMSSPGVDNLGGAGHPGDYSAHWGSRIASSLMISLLADAFKYAAAENGPESTSISYSGTVVTEPYESATARTMERLANRALEQAMSRPPTVTINQGTVLNVYVAKDVDFSAVLPGQ
ncbi:TrbI/VirB10 family protein [Pseudoxanthomonas spadix]|uniref:TrbI/VirB10 family protein n=1 Tax=Pseudoxanthomonas spadix TaxID=415229 RepID=UPI000EFF715A|nr:TrbI/VirB10 family protein [Pseudoxanthomonas spadix]MBP3973847.1 TrbI/VirB10 family protein [Pseudoxanthomonas spadix]RMW95814.1 TrbI/VirB10 family protein [Pseudoxanthomonas spadix]